MRLFAISDLHIAAPQNRAAMMALPDHGGDWLILAGDICERLEHLALAFEVLGGKFARLIWVPGNHELWSLSRDPAAPHGLAKYEAMVALARDFGVLTPEDPYPLWPGRQPSGGGPVVLAPLFLLYDYSFRPDHVPAGPEAVAWAAESGVVCADEALLSPHPFPSREAWCRHRLQTTARRLEAELPRGARTVLINHFPLRQDTIYLPFIPRFSVWSGTRETEDWHRRFNAVACVSGHLHVPRTVWRDGVRFEEVSLGYPQQWNVAAGMAARLREILPGTG